MVTLRIAERSIERPRLYPALDAGDDLVVVRAPLGFGKTTLVRQWLAHRASADQLVARVWVHRGAGDDATFWWSVLDALTDAGLELPPLASQRSARGLVERLLTQTRRPLLLVLDGLDNVVDDAVAELLVDLLADAPEVRLLVALRSHREFFSYLRPGVHASILSAAELLFTTDETAELFDALGVGISTDDAALVHHEMGGWPEATTLMARRLRADGPPADLLHLVNQVAWEFMQHRMLPNVQVPHLFETALVSALPEEFSAEVAELLVDGPSAKAHVQALTREGFLLATDSPDGVVYRWPGASRQALLSTLRRRRPDDLPGLHERLARYYFANSAVAPALTHAVSARAWPLAVDVVERGWRALMTGHHRQLGEALVAIPHEAFTGHDLGIAVRDLVLDAGDDRVLTTPLPPSDDAEIDTLGSTGGARLGIDIGIATVMALRRRGEFGRALEYVDRLQRIAAAARMHRTADVVSILPGLDLQVGLCRLLAGDVRGALQPLQRAYRREADSPVRFAGLDAAATLGMAYALLGEPTPGGRWLERYDALPKGPLGGYDHAGAKAHIARLLIHNDRLATHDASRLNRVLVEFDARDEFWAVRAFARAQHGLHTGALGHALVELHLARAEGAAARRLGGLSEQLLIAAEADLLMALGRGNQARAVLEAVAGDPPMLRVAHARLALLRDDPRAALRLAGDPDWMSPASPSHQREMLVIKAVASHRLAEREAAGQAIAQLIAAIDDANAPRALTTAAAAELWEMARYVPQLTAVLRRLSNGAHRHVFPARLVVTSLTEREQRVLETLADGLTVREAADRLVVSYNTVKTQQRSIYQKLGVDNRRDAIARAREWRLLAS